MECRSNSEIKSRRSRYFNCTFLGVLFVEIITGILMMYIDNNGTLIQIASLNFIFGIYVVSNLLIFNILLKVYILTNYNLKIVC